MFLNFYDFYHVFASYKKLLLWVNLFQNEKYLLLLLDILVFKDN